MAWFEGGGYEGSDGDRAFAEALGDEDARRWDLDYALKKQGLDQQYSIAKLNARTASERNAIDKWYNQEQIKLARDRLAFDRESFQAKMGVDLLGMQAQLRGPRDYFAASNLARGVQAMPGSAAFLDALKNNVTLPGFGAQAGAPEAATLNSLLGNLQTGSAAGGGNGQGEVRPGAYPQSPVDQLHSQIQNIGLQGAHKLGAGSLEQLTPTELGLFRSGLETAGPDGKAFDWDTFMSQYRNSRIGQGLAGSAAA